MEHVDVLTADGQPKGKAVARTVAHTRGLWHRTVHVWIRNCAGELLLQRRSPGKETFPGRWDISAAGHISAGDSSAAAAIREMREELGIAAEIFALRLLHTIRHSYSTPDNTIHDNEFSDVYLYTAPVEREVIVPDPSEVSGVAFYPVNELKRQLIERNDLFVPHDEEYRLLFEVIDGREE